MYTNRSHSARSGYSNNVAGRYASDPALQKPTFNVVAPFMNVTMVQLNHAMSIELQRFISNVGDVEEEISALRAGLRNPAEAGVYIYNDGASFNVIRSFKGVVLIEMNAEMRDMLIDFISDIQNGVDKIIYAFRLALENPEEGRQHRIKRTHNPAGKLQRIRGPQNRSNEYDDPDGGPVRDYYSDGSYESDGHNGDFEEAANES